MMAEDAAAFTRSEIEEFLTHKATDVYVGRYLYVLVRGASGLLFRERRAMLDFEILRPQGKMSFIL
jgi:hypothetical protein